MPATKTSRQPGAPSWFSGAEAAVLLAEERRWLLERLSALPSMPYLWVQPVPAQQALPAPLRGVLLHRTAGGGYAGSLRCALPFPLPSACLGGVVLQHPGRGAGAALIEEAERLLMDGGRVWLCGLTPWSPYRLHWRRAEVDACSPGHWRKRLRAGGLLPAAPRFLGARWRGPVEAGTGNGVGDAFRGAYVIEAEKRAEAPVAPAPLQWRRGAAQVG